jgi:hypothetical protein
MLNAWDAAWDLSEEQCPCDVHFVEWLEAQGICGAAIFHFGTGAHHHVGIRCAENGSDNAVLGITASPGEHEAYVRLALARPDVSRLYKAFFGDIYVLEDRLLPEFEVVTLFHLCEFRSGENDAYGAMTDLAMAQLLVRKTRPGGWVLFYTGSMAFEAARPIVAELEASGSLEANGSFKSLLIYRRPVSGEQLSPRA